MMFSRLPIVAGYGARAVVIHKCAREVLEDQVIRFNVPIINYPILAPGLMWRSVCAQGEEGRREREAIRSIVRPRILCPT
jgi:hypothetical protein